MPVPVTHSTGKIGLITSRSPLISVQAMRIVMNCGVLRDRSRTRS
jgi:hypothetical protein